MIGDHIFREANTVVDALDKGMSGFVQGVLLSYDRRLDIEDVASVQDC